jgi:hypothetical protein
MTNSKYTPTIIVAQPGYFVARRCCRGSDDEMKIELSAVIAWAVFCSVEPHYQKGEDYITDVDVLPVTTVGLARFPDDCAIGLQGCDWLIKNPDGRFTDCDDLFSSADEQDVINHLKERHARRVRTAVREKCASM